MMLKWSPVYFIARLIVTTGMIGFYKRIERKGRQNVPVNKPVIFAPNHQSGFMDPTVIAATMSGQTHFLVRADVFKSKTVVALFKWLKMMPIYRQRDGKDSLEKNQEIFNNCFRILKNKQDLIMFPEGNQQNKKTLRTLKKGVSRVAFGAEDKYDFSLDVHIIPVGINYSHHTKMFSTLYIQFGTPIPLSDYKELYYQNEAKALNELRERLQQELSGLVINIQNKEYYDTIEEIRRICPKYLHKKAGLTVRYLSNDTIAGQLFIEKFERWIKQSPERAQLLKSEVESIRKKTRELNLRYHLFEKEKHAVTISVITLIVFFPLFLIGAILHYIPYKLPHWFVRTKVRDPHFHSSIKMIGGSVLYFIYNSLVASVVGIYFGWPWLLISFSGLPILGFLSFRYWIFLLKTRGRIRYNTLRRKKNNDITEILCLKSQLINELEEVYSVSAS